MAGETRALMVPLSSLDGGEYGQPGRSSGVPATTANKSAIPARVAVCNVAAGTGVPPGTGSSRVAVALATMVGR